MASLLRLAIRQGRIVLLKPPSSQSRVLFEPCCFISTSKKNKDVAVPVNPMPKSPELKRLEEHFADTNPDADKNWTSYGMEPGDPHYDHFTYHVTMFFIISMVICWGSFILAYQPDYKMQNWCRREAFLELERRERLGLPLVSPDLVDPSTIDLSSLDEVPDKDIII